MQRLAGCTAMLALGCATPPPRMVLVLVDTLRADRLGVYGHSRSTTPALDAWAAEATVFETARSPAPWTLPAARALLGAGAPENYTEDDTVVTRLAAAGWYTHAVLANPNLSPAAGFGEGWHAVSMDDGANASAQIGRALEALDEAPAGPTFILVHLMDPHLPYVEDAAYRGLWAGPAPSERLQGAFTETQLRAARLAGAAPLSAEERVYLAARYDQNVRAVDDALGPLLARLRPTDTLIFTADHGEALGEDDHVGHGHALSEPVVRVPLVVGGPGWHPGRVAGAVGLADVGATMLGVAGATRPAAATGRDLRTDRGGHPMRLSHTRVGPARIGLVSGQQKWVATLSRVAHFDLGIDPDEDAPRHAGWTTAEIDHWADAGGPPLDEVWGVALAPAVEAATQLAQPGVEAVTLRHPAGLASVNWPPSARGARPDAAARGDGWRVTSAGPLPRELWFRPLDPGSDPADATLVVRLRDE
ncbi:MAG: sulfatase, partial [Myxococcota bacterium]|nr:sulfatase [Myxococcota bacterium]